MNPDDLHPWLRPHLPTFPTLPRVAADATATGGLLPRPGVDQAKLRALLSGARLPQPSIGAAPQVGLPNVSASPHDVGNMALGDVHALVRNMTGVGKLEDKLAVKRGGMTSQVSVPHTAEEQLHATYGEGDPMLAAIVPSLPEGGGNSAPKIVRAAIKLPDGSIHWGRSHFAAMEAARVSGALPPFKSPKYAKMLSQSVDGFVDEAGNFLTRDEATQRIKDLGAKIGGAGYTSEELQGFRDKKKFLADPNTLPFRGERSYAETFPEPGTPYDALPDAYAILTAENPNGKTASKAANAAANKRLITELRRAGFRPQAALGQYPDDGNLLRENSFLVPNMTPADAVAFGRRFNQNSVITNHGFHDIKAGVTRAMGEPVHTNGDTFTQPVGGHKFVRDLKWDETRPLFDKGGNVAADSLAHIAGPLVNDYHDFYDPAHLKAISGAEADLRKAIQLDEQGKTLHNIPLDYWEQRVANLKGMAPTEYARANSKEGSRFTSFDAEMNWLDRQIAGRRRTLVDQGEPSPDITKLEHRRAMLELDRDEAEQWKDRMARYRAQDRVNGMTVADSTLTSKIANLDAQIRALQKRPGASPYTLRGLQQDRAKAHIDLLLSQHLAAKRARLQ